MESVEGICLLLTGVVLGGGVAVLFMSRDIFSDTKTPKQHYSTKNRRPSKEIGGY